MAIHQTGAKFPGSPLCARDDDYSLRRGRLLEVFDNRGISAVDIDQGVDVAVQERHRRGGVDLQ